MNLGNPSRWVGALLLALVAAAVPSRAADADLAWNSLSATQRQVLAPLQRDWAGIDAKQREKWVEVANRYPSMPAGERQRLQQRMGAWVQMTPAQRAAARQQFQQAKRLPAEERQARWQAYQSLSPEERRQLARRAQPAAGATRQKGEPASAEEAGKRNIVRRPQTSQPRVVAPSVVQASPGATTTTMSTKPAPPLHHQTGLPKIAATPGFVDPATLLPQRGPQGAAVRAAPAASEARGRR